MILKMCFLMQQIFRTPLTGYNVLIHLHKKHVPLAAQAVDAAMDTGPAHTKNSSKKQPVQFPVTDFNPVEKYLTDLEVSLESEVLLNIIKFCMSLRVPSPSSACSSTTSMAVAVLQWCGDPRPLLPSLSK